jgi:L-2-hydroxycarboxylate dehydrogenase (NAD+)
VRLTYADELALIRAVLDAHGAAGQPAALQAHWLAEADLRGHPSHGLQRLPVIAHRIDAGLSRPNAVPEIDWRTPSVAVINGGRALGPSVGMFAVESLAERAKTTGSALAAVHNANHLGLLALYVEALARRGLIGVVLTTTEPLVHPWNGIPAMVGTNPIAIGVPTDVQPFVLDMATSAVSMGKILAHRHRRQPLQPGWAVDELGQPTTDPGAARALSPFGGAKGYGLAVALGLIVAAASGSALGPEITGTLDTETVCNKGDLFVCLDPAVLGTDDQAARTSYLETLRATPAVNGTNGVSIPGDQARARRALALEEGVEVPEAVINELRSLAGAAELDLWTPDL